MGVEQALDLGPHRSAVLPRSQLQLQQGIVEGETLGTAAAGQPQELPFERRHRRRGGRRHGFLQQQRLVGLLHQIGDQEQIDQLADPTDAEGEQPQGAAEGLAVVEALQPAEAHQGQAPQQVAHGHGPAFLQR